MRRLAPGLTSPYVVALAAAAATFAASVPASACFFPPASRLRTVYPLGGAIDVPTNARPRVVYTTGPQAESMCGAKPAAPVLRLAAPADGGAAPDGGAGAEVPGQWVQATDHDPRDSVIWEFRPAAPLAPRTVYELVDPYPESCSCDPKPCAAGAPAAFARFTTGDGPDDVKPTFGGVLAALCFRSTCEAADINCCGPYDHMTMRFQPQPNATDDNLVGIRYYVRKEGQSYDFTHPVAPGEINDPVDHPYTIRWDVPLDPGKYHLLARAFDLAGNEDGNMVEATFVLPLRTDPICQRALIDAGPGPDFAFPPLPDGTSMYGLDMTGTSTSSGCACSISDRQRQRDARGALLACVVVGALLVRRRAIR